MVYLAPCVARVSSIIVCSSEDSEVIAGAVASLLRQDSPPDEVVVVDNSPDARHEAALGGLGIVYHAAGRNLGYAGAVTAGAGLASGDFLFLLNPDAEAAPDCLCRLLEALEAEPAAAIAGAQILLPDGRVNAGDNPIHLTGLCWSGNYLGVREDGPVRTTLAVSGASILIRRRDFDRLGGFSPALFMYFDDAELCWRARVAGHSVLFCPSAIVEHDYEFDKGPRKWTWLEESRLAVILTNYEARTLVVLAPYLIATELVILLAALKGGWITEKLRAYPSVWRRRGAIRVTRRQVRLSRKVSDRELVPEFAPVVDSPILDSPLMRLAAGPQLLYARLVRLLLR
jgi:GT2 family glycosyltransferase